MEYQHKITIDRPRPEVVKKFSDPENMKHWQRGFISMKPINGELGKEASQNLLLYKMGKREIEMVETIMKNTLPDEFNAIYEAKGVYNVQKNKFIENSDHTTDWITNTEFRFTGFMKIIGWIMPGTFKKQSYQFMKDFKAFCEEDKSVLNN